MFDKIQRNLWGPNKQIVIKRFKDTLKISGRTISNNVEVKVPCLPFVDVGKMFLRQLEVLLVPFLPPGTVCEVRVGYAKPLSIKDLLVNSKGWANHVDNVDFPCTCDSLEEILGCERENEKHICVR